ncbi:hypothetical protein ANN_16306 [Periplaneta americana]|uniref:Uncharacterized protein n=1 Tax=Periplaneta americana TaxID=6978 RepID=A0ABQ8SJZ6_PERAM|nr:hypothetical protein ANN_16306 [Periplaneta americana]
MCQRRLSALANISIQKEVIEKYPRSSRFTRTLWKNTPLSRIGESTLSTKIENGEYITLIQNGHRIAYKSIRDVINDVTAIQRFQEIT